MRDDMSKPTMETHWYLVEWTPSGFVRVADKTPDVPVGVATKFSVGWDLAAMAKVEGFGYEQPKKPKVNWSVPTGTHVMLGRSDGTNELQRVVVVGPCNITDEWTVRFVSGDGRLSPPTKVTSELLAMGITCDPIPTHEPTETRGRTRLKPGHSL